jgi:hypothetical protein
MPDPPRRNLPLLATSILVLVVWITTLIWLAAIA